MHRDGDVTEFRFRSRLPGVPGPAPKLVSRITRTPGERVDVRYAPPPHNRVPRLVSRFAASWTCRPVPGGTRVCRTVELSFVPPLRWFLEPLLRRALPADLDRELAGAAGLVGGCADTH